MIVFFIVLLLLLCPQDALAWGPGVHMALGNHILGNLHLFTPSLAAVLSTYPENYLYGCLSADIFIGKGCAFTPTHSHNWDMGRKLLRQAESPGVEAYAWGYLSHLAADVIAHNYLVPNMLGFSAGRGKLAHTYVEMLADLQVQWPRKQASRIFRTPHPHSDRTLISAMDQKTLSFRIKKHIFRQSLQVLEDRTYKRSLLMFRRLLPFAHKEALIRESISFAQDLVVDLLVNPVLSPVLQCDPIGSSNLFQVRRFRRKQRLYYTQHGQGIIFPLDSRLEPCLHTSGESYAHLSRFSA